MAKFEKRKKLKEFSDNYQRKKRDAERTRPYRKAVFKEFGLTDDDWLSTSRHTKARAVTCYIAHHYLGASFDVCKVVCNYNAGSNSGAHRGFHMVQESPELLLMAEYVFKKVNQLREAECA